MCMCVCMPHIRADCQNASYATEAGLSDTWLASKFRGERFLPGTRGRCAASLQGSTAFTRESNRCGRQPAAGANRSRASSINIIATRAPFPSGTLEAIATSTAFRDQCVIKFFRRKIEFVAVRVYVCHRIVHDRRRLFQFFITIRVRYVTEYLMRNNGGSSSADVVYGVL